MGLTVAPASPFPILIVVSFSIRDPHKRCPGLRDVALTTQSDGLGSKVTRELLMGCSPISLLCQLTG